MKKLHSKKYNTEIEGENIVNEPNFEYYIPAKMPVSKKNTQELLLKDFLYHDFKTIANNAPFSLAEWAEMLHISERTIQRYAKENSEFNGLQIEIILLAEKMIEMGNELFGKTNFKNWLHVGAFSLNNRKPIDFLHSYSGIQTIINLLGRLQHGVSA